MAHKSDAELLSQGSVARFFVETPQVSWVLIIGTLLWGIFAFLGMPQRKDPLFRIRWCSISAVWPGASAEKVEQLVTRKIEIACAANSKVEDIYSNSRTGFCVVTLSLNESVTDPGKEFDDLKLRLDSLTDLPDGAGPIQFFKDYGETATLMLTVASPRVSEAEIVPRARIIRQTIENVRATAPAEHQTGRVSLIYGFPQTIGVRLSREPLDLFVAYAREHDFMDDIRLVTGPGFVGVDGQVSADDSEVKKFADAFLQDRLQASELHPDAWKLAVVRRPEDTVARLTEAAGDKYSYRELDDYTDLIQRTLKAIPGVSRVTRSAVLGEAIYLMYSQQRLASYGIAPASLASLLQERNISIPGGQLEVQGKTLTVNPSGEFKSEKEIEDVLVGTSSTGTPLYLRDLVEVVRAYESPARYLNYYIHPDAAGVWQRSRAITLSIHMNPADKISDFATAVNASLADLKERLPSDLILARTSDQALQVKESVGLFMTSLTEAVGLVVLASLIGFWEWRSALLMAISIPLTLTLTFGMMAMLGLDVQQVSIASLILALGLLIDDPVVAGDSIKREMAGGRPPNVAAWLGPNKLANAILYATVTNIVAYLPLLLLTGDTGTFLYSLPVVITCSLVASRIVSMTFLPLLGSILLRPTVLSKGPSRLSEFYHRVGRVTLRYRWVLVLLSFGFLGLGGLVFTHLKSEFFPKDLSYLCYVNVWLPEDAPASESNKVAARAETILRQAANDYGREHGRPGVLRSLLTFVGGGSPRFWYNLATEQQQPNYAQIVIEVLDKHDTQELVPRFQQALSEQLLGARCDVCQLESGKPVGIPVQVQISGDNLVTLRQLAREVKKILGSSPLATRLRDNWGEESFSVNLQTDSDRANLAGVSHRDVAISALGGLSGLRVSTLVEGDRQIPVVARLKMDEGARLEDVGKLYVYSKNGGVRVPMQAVSSMSYELVNEKILHKNQFRVITVGCFPVGNHLPSEIMQAVQPQLDAFEKKLPPGYRMEIEGEAKERGTGFKQLVTVFFISCAMIYFALTFEFKHAIKPFIVFAAIPYGVMGAIFALYAMHSTFGFMAFLGIVSLVGVIVSHIIVLFDSIEDARERGESLEDSLLGAVVTRLRPVLLTVGATVVALVPLAERGGPLWEPMCYAQIGGLLTATFLTLFLVPLIYAIFVLDLRLVKWEASPPPGQALPLSPK